MIQFDTTVRIDRSLERVIGVLSDLEVYLQRWAHWPIAATRIAGDGGVGTRYLVMARFGHATVRSPYQVTGHDPPQRLAGNGVAGPVRFHEECTLKEQGAATILTQSITASTWPTRKSSSME